MGDDSRIGREREFHDRRFATEAIDDPDDPRRAARKYYEAAQAGPAAYAARLQVAPGSRVLEYGCGVGSEAFNLAERGARVTAIDISPVALEIASEEARRRLLDIDFVEMNAEELTFADASYDLVCGSAILHHLVLDVAIPQIARVLAPGGRAVFLEPLGHNPLINMYRKRTPEMRTPDEHPLLMSDLAVMQSYFANMETEYFEMFSLAAAPLLRVPGVRKVTPALSRLDHALFTHARWSRKYAWTVLIDLRASSRA
jgi:ubiquinone/menaquinone biosynthesis C-methylase UbiE